MFLGESDGYPLITKCKWSEMFRGTFEDCIYEFFTNMRTIFGHYGDGYCPNGLDDIDVGTPLNCSFKTDGVTVIGQFKTNQCDWLERRKMKDPERDLNPSVIITNTKIVLEIDIESISQLRDKNYPCRDVASLGVKELSYATSGGLCLGFSALLIPDNITLEYSVTPIID